MSFFTISSFAAPVTPIRPPARRQSAFSIGLAAVKWRASSNDMRHIIALVILAEERDVRDAVTPIKEAGSFSRRRAREIVKKSELILGISAGMTPQRGCIS